jgi:hypothetical protein
MTTRAAGVPLPTFILLALVSTLIAFYAPRDVAAQDTPPGFEPGGIACLEDYESAADCDGDPAPGASTDIRTRFCVGWNPDCSAKASTVTDSNFGAVVTFVPPSFTVPVGDTLPLGSLAGRLDADATLGLLNNPCNSTIGVSFSLMNASIDVNDTIDPKPVGDSDVMEPLALDSNGNGLPDGIDKYPSFLVSFFDPDHDFGPDQIPFTGDDVNGPAGTIEPRARLAGYTRVQGSWISLQFLFFEPGTTVEDADQNPLTLDPNLGYPSVTILQDPTVPPAQSAITGFCAPLRSANVTFGLTRDNPCTPSAPPGRANCPSQTVYENRGYPLFPCETGNAVDEDGDGAMNDGCPQANNVAESGAQCNNETSDDGEDSDINDGCPQVGAESEASFLPDPDGCDTDADEASCENRKNPADAGAVPLTIFAASQRDADGDGIENGLDPCTLKSDSFNPRAPDPTNDPDSDGLPSDCDPDPNAPSPGTPQSCPSGFTGADEDQDCFTNRQDNCPLINQLENPSDSASSTNKPRLVDGDRDGIGDPCDVTSGGDALFGNSQNGPDKTDGTYAALCLEFPITIGAGASTAAQSGPDVVGTTLDCVRAGGTDGGGGGGGDGGGTNGGTNGGTDGGTDTEGGAGGPSTGVGALAPAVGSIPTWAAIASGLGGAGFLGSIGAFFSRFIRRRRL